MSKFKYEMFAKFSSIIAIFSFSKPQMDPKIWQNIRNGDALAMKTLYQECYQELFAFGFKMVADKDKIKDCLHEIFCDIWQKRSQIGEVNHLKAYLKTCVRNKLLKEIKLDQKTDQISDHEFEHLTENSYEQLLIAAETDADSKAKMWRAINELTPMQREIINLKFFEELNYDAIAVMLKLKPRTVYNHVYAAICKLRDELSAK